MNNYTDLCAQLETSCYLAFDDGTNDYATANKASAAIRELEGERDEWKSLAEAAIADDAAKNIHYAEVQAKLAEVEKERDSAIRGRDDWRDDYKALSAAIVGDTGLSAMTVATQARMLRPRAEAAEATVTTLTAQVEAMQNLLCLADETIMELNGCFPLGHGQMEYKLRQACLAIRAVTGDDHDERKRRAALTTENPNG